MVLGSIFIIMTKSVFSAFEVVAVQFQDLQESFGSISIINELKDVIMILVLVARWDE